MSKHRITLRIAVLFTCMIIAKIVYAEPSQNALYSHRSAVKSGTRYNPIWETNEDKINTVLSHTYQCSNSIQLRFQAMSEQQINQACELLKATEKRFHSIFGTHNRPVMHDHNHRLRANIYASKEQYTAHVTEHFDVPFDNGGMYLEGQPHLAANQAEYVAFMRDGEVWNLNHEYVHYLDGRFNLYGGYCAGLHDGHSAPEYCPKPAPQSPYLIWWTEGIAEYVAHMKQNAKAVELASEKTYALSQLFYNSVENWSTERVYLWGYLAVRYMMEKQRDKVEQMLFFTRQGNYSRCQSLMLSWGTSMDEDFDSWLVQLTKQ